MVWFDPVCFDSNYYNNIFLMHHVISFRFHDHLALSFFSLNWPTLLLILKSGSDCHSKVRKNKQFSAILPYKGIATVILTPVESFISVISLVLLFSLALLLPLNFYTALQLHIHMQRQSRVLTEFVTPTNKEKWLHIPDFNMKKINSLPFLHFWNNTTPPMRTKGKFSWNFETSKCRT